MVDATRKRPANPSEMDNSIMLSLGNVFDNADSAAALFREEPMYEDRDILVREMIIARQ